MPDHTYQANNSTKFHANVSDCLLVIFYLLLGMMITSSVCAQDLNPSHRVIEGMPQDLSGLHSQLEFLKQLQHLGMLDRQLNTPQQFPQEQGSALDQLNPEMLKALQNAAKNMGMQTEGNVNKPHRNQPQAQPREKQSANQNPSPIQIPNTSTEQQEQMLQSLLRSVSERTGTPVDELIEQAQQMTEGKSLQQKPASQRNPNIKPARRPDRSLSGQGRDTENSTTLPNNPMRSNQRDDNGLFTGRNRALPAPDALNWDKPENIQAPTDNSEGGASDVDPHSITEFNSDALKQLDRLMKRTQAGRQGKDELPTPIAHPQLSGSDNASTLNSTDLNKAANTAMKELSESPAGFREKLRSVMKFAKQQSTQQPTNSNGTDGSQEQPAGPPPAGLQTALTQALESTARQMFTDEQAPKINAANKQSESTPSPTSKTARSGTNKKLRSWEKAATQMMSKIAAAPPASDNTTTSKPQPAAPKELQDFPWQPLLALFIGAAIALLALIIFQRRKTYQVNAAAIKALPNEVRTREDVIRAFHTIIGQRIEPYERWWPHRRAAAVVSHKSPHIKPVITALCSVYESARYLPEEHSLTTAQLETARNAVQSMKAEV